jgi:hypothetical protein
LRPNAETLPNHEAVMSLVERGGKVRSRHVADVTATTLKPILVETVAKDTHFRTDQAPSHGDKIISFDMNPATVELLIEICSDVYSVFK